MKKFLWSNKEILLAVVFLVVVVIVVGIRSQPIDAPVTATATPEPAQEITLDPRIIANMTNLPQSTPLSGQQANQLNGLRQLVDACSEYTSARRDQMDEQIGFIVNPAELTGDIIMALGDNPQAKLLYALVEVTKNQWLLDKSPTNSCLIPIGKSLNQLLTTAGGTPEAVFEGG